METIDIKDLKRQEFKRKLKQKVVSVKDGLKRGVQWVKENPKESLALGSAAVFGLREFRLLGNSLAERKERRDLDRSIYDPSTHRRIHLRRKLSNKELLELDDRVRSGQSRIEALDEMRLLK